MILVMLSREICAYFSYLGFFFSDANVLGGSEFLGPILEIFVYGSHFFDTH